MPGPANPPGGGALVIDIDSPPVPANVAISAGDYITMEAYLTFALVPRATRRRLPTREEITVVAEAGGRLDTHAYAPLVEYGLAQHDRLRGDRVTR